MDKWRQYPLTNALPIFGPSDGCLDSRRLGIRCLGPSSPACMHDIMQYAVLYALESGSKQIKVSVIHQIYRKTSSPNPKRLRFYNNTIKPSHASSDHTADSVESSHLHHPLVK
jgi:hypothetical protein